MRRDSVRRLITGGLLTALVLVMTYAVKIPVPATGGYVHPGDGAVLFAGLVCGPFGAVIAGVGSAMSDLLGGYALYIAPTFFIKAAMGLVAGCFSRRGAHVRNAVVFSVAAIIMALGYFAFESAIYGVNAAYVALGANLLQGAAGVVIGMLLSLAPLPAFVTLNFKKK